MNKFDTKNTRHSFYAPADKADIWKAAMKHCKELDITISEYINIAVKEKLVSAGKIIEIEKKD